MSLEGGTNVAIVPLSLGFIVEKIALCEVTRYNHDLNMFQPVRYEAKECAQSSFTIES